MASPQPPTISTEEAFLRSATERFVLVELDFPRGEEARSRVPNPRRNAELARRYEITGYPTILVLTPDGEVLGRTGYRPGGAESYAAHVEELRSHGRRALALAPRIPYLSLRALAR